MKGIMNRSLATSYLSNINGESESNSRNYTMIKSKNNGMAPLGEYFLPSDNDVICGRGKKCYFHSGNVRFRQIVLDRLDQYKATQNKQEKSMILSLIIAEVRKSCVTVGGFVKIDPTTRLWYEVGNFLAREKTSQAFRDVLHQDYRSSNKSKQKRRQREQINSKKNGADKVSPSPAKCINFQEMSVFKGARPLEINFESMLRKKNREFLMKEKNAAANKTNAVVGLYEIAQTSSKDQNEYALGRKTKKLRLLEEITFPIAAPTFYHATSTKISSSSPYAQEKQQQKQQQQHHSQHQQQLQHVHHPQQEKLQLKTQKMKQLQLQCDAVLSAPKICCIDLLRRHNADIDDEDLFAPLC